MSFRSINAYKDILPKLGTMEKRILYALDLSPLKAEQVSARTNMNVITARARLSELFDEGIVAQTKEGFYYITLPNEKAEVQRSRLEAKYQKWKRLGEKHNWHFRYDTIDKHGRPPQPEDYEQPMEDIGELPFK